MFSDLFQAALDALNSRPVLWGPHGPVPQLVGPECVHAWCELHDIPTSQRSLFWRVVKDVETALNDRRARKAEERDDGPEAKPAS